jgi:hypothetical protein
MRAISRALTVLKSDAPSALGRYGDVSLGLARHRLPSDWARGSDLALTNLEDPLM